MTIDITGRHLELTPALREHAEEKISKLGRLVEDLDIHVTLAAEKHRYTCTIVARGRTGVHTGETTGDDLYATIHEAVDVLARRLRKNKTSRLSDRREGAPTIRRLEEAEPTTAEGGQA
ncbi:MAG: ribosome-associated translation inhibitor RaiA [Acidobacteria bacterium]|nr:MAG: ribosome-associated translation inhibitor RaiA [Acidobacteriota bacterium]